MQRGIIVKLDERRTTSLTLPSGEQVSWRLTTHVGHLAVLVWSDSPLVLSHARTQTDPEPVELPQVSVDR